MKRSISDYSCDAHGIRQLFIISNQLLKSKEVYLYESYKQIDTEPQFVPSDRASSRPGEEMTRLVKSRPGQDVWDDRLQSG